MASGKFRNNHGSKFFLAGVPFFPSDLVQFSEGQIEAAVKLNGRSGLEAKL
jgi:hypothetical protein